MKRFLIVSALVAQAALAQPGAQDYASQLRIARIYEETRDLANAARLYGELYKLHPELSEIADGYFRVLYASKRFEEAEQVIRKRIETGGEDFEQLLTLAKTLARQNKHDDAMKAFARAEKAGAELPPYSRAVGIAGTMMEVSYAEEALDFLKRARKESSEPDLLTGEIGSLYYKLGRYEEGTREYVSLLATNDAMLNYIQQRIAFFGADTGVRVKMLRAIVAAITPQKATLPQLRLLAWSYGELKDYRSAYETMQLLDARAEVSGYELLQFAERARNERALDVAVDAYKEAVARLKKSGAANDQRRQYFISQAELGALKVEASYLISRPNGAKADIAALAAKFRQFADTHRENDLVLEALLRGGELAFRNAFDLDLAKSLYDECTKRSAGYNERASEAYFAIEEIALIRSDFDSARQTLGAITALLDKRNRPEDTDARKRIAFERARLDYFGGNFDTATAQLEAISTDAESEQANDAIALKGFIEDNRDASDVTLKLYVKAEHATFGRDYPAAISALRSIRESAPNAPVTDDAILRESELLVKTGKPEEAVRILEAMQTKMATSPLVDRAGFRIAEITETALKQPQVAQRLYEEFLERYAKSPLASEARKRARRLRGDPF